MAAIYLIRHGQASFGKADYDQLSEKGSLQAQLLGKFWRSQPSPDKVYLGDLLRHEQTLENFLVGYDGSKPSAILHSGFNEFNHVELLQCYDMQWKNFAAMAEKVGQSTNAADIFQREFSSALTRWTSGKYDGDYIESWPEFKKRCIAALHDVINQALSVKKSLDNSQAAKEICIFTSGGTISVLMQHILGLTDESTLAVIQQLRNTGVTKLLFSNQQINIDYLNNYSHLTQAGTDWATFR